MAPVYLTVIAPTEMGYDDVGGDVTPPGAQDVAEVSEDEIDLEAPSQ
jgi:hypothetical protein